MTETKKSTKIIGIGIGVFLAIFGVASVLFPESDEPKRSPAATEQVSTSTKTVNYLAVPGAMPMSDADVPVAASKETMRQMIDAAKANDQATWNQLIPSSVLAVGGSVVEVVSTDGDLTQVRMINRDTKGVDRSGFVGWTGSSYVQSKAYQ